MQPLLNLTPTFIPQKVAYECVAVAFFSFIMLGIYPLIGLFFPEKDMPAFATTELLIAATILLTVLPTPVYYFWRKMTFANTHYHLFADHINYQESFLNAEEKEFSYERVTETALRRNILQRMFNVGTVVLLTPASGSPNQMHSGLKLQDLENPQETYAQIKEILKASGQSKAA